MKTILLPCFAACSVFAASPIAGNWTAVLDDGKEKVYLSLVVTDTLGKLRATMTNIDNGTKFPIETIVFDGKRFEITTTRQRGIYRGKVVNDDIEGVWRQDGASLPLNFSRVPGTPETTISAAERQFAVSYLERTRDEFLNAIRGLTAAQWNYKPAGGGWSLAECAEHITLSEDIFFDLITKVANMPMDPNPLRTGRGRDEQIIKALTDRSKKAKAPEILVPSGKYASPDLVMAAFSEKRARTVEFVKTTMEDLRGKMGPSEQFGSVDAYQYLLFLAGHSARHTTQLLEVKADPGFPK